MASITERFGGVGDAGSGEGEREDGVGGRPLAAVFLVVQINVIGLGVVIPLLPFYAEQFGASPLVIGPIFASFGPSQFVGVPRLGWCSDRFGRRPILLLSLVGSVVGFVLLALAQSLAVIFLARVVDGATGGNISTARAVIADVTKAEDRARGFGTIGAAFGVGLILGPALGGFLAGFGCRVPAWTAAGMAVAAGALCWVWLPETKPAGATPHDWPWTDARRLLARPTVARYLGTDLGWWTLFGAFQTTFPLFVAARLRYGATGTGLLLAYLGAINALVQLRLIGPIADRLGDRRTWSLGLGIATLGMAGLALAPTSLLLVAALRRRRGNRAGEPVPGEPGQPDGPAGGAGAVAGDRRGDREPGARHRPALGQRPARTGGGGAILRLGRARAAGARTLESASAGAGRGRERRRHHPIP